MDPLGNDRTAKADSVKKCDGNNCRPLGSGHFSPISTFFYWKEPFTVRLLNLNFDLPIVQFSRNLCTRNVSLTE